MKRKATSKARKSTKRSRGAAGDLPARRGDVKGGLLPAVRTSGTPLVSPAQRWVVGKLSQ